MAITEGWTFAANQATWLVPEAGDAVAVIGQNQAHSMQSSAREKVLEHLFVGELLRCLWCRGARDTEILRSEVDNGGYDVVLEGHGVMRHIQFKASHRQARTAQVGINVSLVRRPSGCVIWIKFDPETMELGPFLWFGGDPGQPLPPLGDRIGRHTKGDRTGTKAERPNIRLLRRSCFTTLRTIGEVADRLFGDYPLTNG